MQSYAHYDYDEGLECFGVFIPTVPRPVGFVAVGDNDYLPKVQPSSTHVSVRKGWTHSLKFTFAQVPTRRDYE